MKSLILIVSFILITHFVFGQNTNNETVYSVVDTMPQYPGGDSALMTFIARNIDYPIAARMDGVKGNVYVGFVVNSLGKVENIKVMRGIRADLDSASVDVMKKVGDWKPGILNGKNVSVSYTLPIKFELSESQGTMSLKEQSDDDKRVFTITQKMPEYPGGENELLKDIGRLLIFPLAAKEDGVRGRVYVQFIVDKEGNVKDVKIVQGVRADVDTAAVQAVRGLKQWTPGEQKGKKVQVVFTLPISFMVDDGTNSGVDYILNNSGITFEKKNFATNEQISFYIKSKDGFVSPTISCSCGKSDFYYQVYKINGTGLQDSLIVDHTETSNTERCTCKYGYFKFMPDALNSIPSISEKGEYYIRLFNRFGTGYSSGNFTVQ